MPRLTIDFSRRSIYPAPKGSVTNFSKVLPAALATAWRAPDGTVGIALASVHNGPLSLRLDLTGLRDQLPERAQVYYVDANGRRNVGRFVKSQAGFALELSTRGACVVELVRD